MKLIPTSINPVTITLYRGIPFDNNYNEHTLFADFKFKAYPTSSEVDVGHSKEDLINIKNSSNEYIYPRTTKTGTYNFAFGNGIVTSLAMELTENEINSNYMKVTSGTDDYYYFITGVTQKNESMYLLNLELDVFMTFGSEFLTNVNNKPIMVERKHCRRVMRLSSIGNRVIKRINDVCFNQETTFSHFKSNIVKSFTPLEFKDFIGSEDTADFNAKMSDINWIYIIYGKKENYPNVYRENGSYYPYNVICLPTKQVKIEFTHNNETKTAYVLGEGNLSTYVEDASVQKIILSPFPPFKDCTMLSCLNDTESYLKIKFLRSATYNSTTHFYTLSTSYEDGQQNFGLRVVSTSQSGALYCDLFVINGFGGNFGYKPVEDYFTTEIPNINNLKDKGEYKLQIAPFKDLRMNCYYGDENYVNTQYLFLTPYETDEFDLNFYTITSTNPESNSYYNYCDLNYAIESKNGVNNAVSYNYPTGTNAEILFNQTQGNQYTTSKTISAISNGLKTVGGILAVALAPSPMGKMAGALAIGSGVVGEVDTLVDWGAKAQDLKNTPNTYNFSGSSYSYDKSFVTSSSNASSMLPYLLVYGVNTHEENMASDFLYHYGYEYNEESYFNTNMTNGIDGIFNRQLFNYVKIKEDATSKIVGDNLPIPVAKKINDVLNAGIKFWTFFNVTLDETNLNKYFQKSTYCNAELVGENL